MKRPATAAAIVGVTFVACSRAAPSAIDPRGPGARHVADLWWIMLGVGAAVYVVVMGLLLVAVVRGRSEDTSGPRAARRETMFIAVGGIAVPAVILLFLMALLVRTDTLLVGGRVRDPLRVEVIGRQWWWEVRYPDAGVVTANEIHVPAGRPVEMTVTSADVIHSFWVPQLYGKVDMIPGKRNTFTFEASSPGRYRGQCAEYCGIQHALMITFVVADRPEAFDRWLDDEAADARSPSTQPAARGREVFLANACVACHTIRGTPADGTLGPDLTHFGNRETLGAGAADNTPGVLGGWIADAQSIKRGSKMPPMPLSGPDLQDLIAYLESLT